MRQMVTDRDFIVNFIETYKCHPCLWNKKDKNYFNDIKKEMAYNDLLCVMKIVDPTSTINTVKRKINSIRSSYRRECNKVMSSIKSGAGVRDIYQPSLWYFDILNFLSDQEELREGIISAENVSDKADSGHDGTANADGETEGNIDDDEPLAAVTVSLSPPTTPLYESSVISSSSTAVQKKKQSAAEIAKEKILISVASRLENPQEHSEFGAYVEAELRKMPSEMVPFVKKLINEVLFEGQMRTLSRLSRVETGQNPYQTGTENNTGP